MDNYTPQRGDIRLHENKFTANWAASEWRGFAWVNKLNGYWCRSYVEHKVSGMTLLRRDNGEEYYRAV